MSHPLLKSTLWGLAGIITHLSTVPPSGNVLKNDSADRGIDGRLMGKYRQFYGIPVFWGLTWALTISEIMTVLSPSFRRITSFPESHDVSSIDGTFLVAFTSLVVFFVIRICCYKALGNFFTLDVAIRPNHKLITNGLYGFVRHPSYTCMFGIAVSDAFLHLSMIESWELWWLFCAWTFHTAMGCYGLVARTRNEDEMLRKNFGTDWVLYRKRVQYRFVPGML